MVWKKRQGAFHARHRRQTVTGAIAFALSVNASTRRAQAAAIAGRRPKDDIDVSRMLTDLPPHTHEATATRRLGSAPCRRLAPPTASGKRGRHSRTASMFSGRPGPRSLVRRYSRAGYGDDAFQRRNPFGSPRTWGNKRRSSTRSHRRYGPRRSLFDERRAAYR